MPTLLSHGFRDGELIDKITWFGYVISSTMLIGLLSDTHIRSPGYRVGLSQLHASVLPPQIKDAFHGVDLILHAGDIYTLPILDELETIAPVVAAEGDDDPFEIMNDKRVKYKHVITVEGVTIWLAHQYETWSPDEHETPPDVIVFGHTHRATLENNGGIIRINFFLAII